jgi:putative spermidine/putrescine transport system permease protein
MKSSRLNLIMRIALFIFILIILTPVAILFIWTFASRWPWPNLLPQAYSLRAVRDLFAPHTKLLSTLFSSVCLSLTVAVLSTIIATMTARALVFYDFRGKGFIEFLSMAPMLVPGTVFAMGIHAIFIKMYLSDTVAGVIIVHLIYTLPYTVNIMKDLTKSIGEQMEIQAYVLGASPFKSFLYVTFPLLIPGIIASITMAYITSISQYFISLLIGGGKVKTISIIMVPFIAKGDRSIGSAYALVFIFSTLAVFIVIKKIFQRICK